MDPSQKIYTMTRRSIEICTALEKDILGGHLTAGELVNEIALADRFGVSRTPVREALLSLASTGLVRLQPGRGAIVVGVSLQQVFDAYEVLSALFGLAAALCAMRLTPLERAQLQTLHEKMGSHMDAKEREDYMRLDDQVHELIVKGAGNPMLAHQIAQCHRTIAAVRHASMESHISLDVVYEEHAEVVRAVLARDEESARHAMSAHLQLRGDKASHLVALWQQQAQGSGVTV
jgi:DNA-binding GntR family transcriptional regulator